MFMIYGSNSNNQLQNWKKKKKHSCQTLSGNSDKLRFFKSKPDFSKQTLKKTSIDKVQIPIIGLSYYELIHGLHCQVYFNCTQI